MKVLSFAVFAAGLLACAGSVRAQNLVLKDGQTITTSGVRRDGASVLAKIKTPSGGEGELGYPVGNIARIEFPDPAVRKTAPELLAQNKPEEALRQLGPALTYYAPFRDVPGNWWSQLAILQVDALSRLGRDAEMQAVITDLNRMGAADPAILRAVKIRQGISLERKGQYGKALDILNPVVRDEDAPPASVAEGWLAVGGALLGQRNYRAAQLAYLHVPVYSPELTGLMPSALLGSGAALVGLDDKGRATNTFQDLIKRFPNSPEAADAKNRLKNLNGPNADKTASQG